MFCLFSNRCRRVRNKAHMQVASSLFGLVFACLSAALILASVHPLPRLVVPSNYMLRHVNQHHSSNTQAVVVTPVDNDHAPGPSTRLPHPTSPHNETNSSAATTKSKSFLLVETNDKNNAINASQTNRRLDEGQYSTTATRTIPAVMVGVSSAIILCALLLYCFDVRDRCCDGKHGSAAQEGHGTNDFFHDDTNSHKHSVHDGGSMTSASSGRSEPDFSGIWCSEKKSNMLPPMDYEQQDDLLENGQGIPEELSLSHVSALTDPAEEEDNVKAVESPSSSCQLKTHNRGPSDEDLHVPSECSSLTSASATTVSDNFTGEESLEEGNEEFDEVLSATKDTPNSKACSLDFSQETTPVSTTLQNVQGVQSSQEQRDAANDEKQDPEGVSQKRESPVHNELAQLEKVVASSVHSKGGMPPSPVKTTPSHGVLRDIYFFPISKGSKATIGLKLNDATSSSSHPTVANVDSSSSFAGRIFDGDSIVKVNDTGTTGLSGAQLLTLLEGAKAKNVTGDDDRSTQGLEEMLKVVKVTVLSCEKDDASLSDDGGRSLDYGRPETRIEV